MSKIEVTMVGVQKLLLLLLLIMMTIRKKEMIKRVQKKLK